MIYFGYLANYNKRAAFATHFLICSDLLDCLRSVGTMVITTESSWNSLKIIFTKQSFTKVTIFCYFDVCSVRPPKIFHIQGKISTVQSVFPDYLSLSYDYDISWNFMLLLGNKEYNQKKVNKQI